MSTTATTPATPTLASLEPHWVQVYTSFIKAHEKLLLIVVGGFLLFHMYDKGVTAWANHEQRVANAQQVKVVTDEAANKQLQEQLAEMQIQFKAADAARRAQIATLAAQLKSQQEADKIMPLPDLGNRWATLINLPPTSIVATPDNKMTVTGDVAHATVNQLEQVPVLTKQNTLLTNDLNECKVVSGQQDKTIAGLNTELTDEKSARAADARAAKAAQRKAWLRGFKWGAITGFVAGVFVGHGV